LSQLLISQFSYGREAKILKTADLARYYAVVFQGLALQAQHGGTRKELIRVLDAVMASWPEQSPKKSKK